MARSLLIALLLVPAALVAQGARPAVAVASVDAATATRLVDSILAGALKDGRAAGAVVYVVRGADTLVAKGYGRLDLERDVPMRTDAVFEIGSVTKQFTAALLLQFVAEGRLSLDDSIGRHWPDAPAEWSAIPVRRLLDHTSGIRSYTATPRFGLFATRFVPRDSIVALSRAAPADFAPGAEMRYNNTGFYLAGMLVERLGAKRYEQLVQERLFDRVGMKRSSYCDRHALVRDRAEGYDWSGSALRRAGYVHHAHPFAAGSLCSTASDLVKWNRALHGGAVIPAAQYAAMTTPSRLVDGTPLRYGLGLALPTIAGHRAVSHGGDIPGYSSFLLHLPEQRAEVVVLVNTLGPVRPDALADRVAQAVFGPGPAAPVPVAGGDALARDVVGSYGAPPAAIVVLATGDSLSMARAGATPRRMTPIGEDVFAVGDERLRVVREGGKVVAVVHDAVYVVRRLPRSD